MPNFNTAYEISFRFSFKFFAADDATADTLADALVAQIFGSLAFSVIEKVTGAGSGVTLVGQDVAGKNYEYVYDVTMKIGEVSLSSFHNIFSADADTALAQINEASARATGISNFPAKINYLNEV